jgi:phosphatidylinositol 4-kinase
MTEREGSYKSRTTSVDRDLVKAAGADYSRNKSYDGPARRSNEGQTSPELTLSRSSSFKGAVDKAAFHGISECDGDLAFPRDGSHEAPNNQEEEVDMVEQLYGSMSVHDTQDISLPEYQPKIHNRSVDEAAWQRAEARRSLQLSSPPMLQSQNGAVRPSHKRTHSRADKTARKPLTIDEYAERMRMAAIMLSQLNASQQLPRSGTDAVTGVVGAGVGLGVNLTYGVGSVVGSVVGVGVGAVRAGLGSIGTTTSLSALPDTNAAPSGQASSGVTAPIDSTTAASGLSSVAGTVNPAILPEDGTTPVYSAQQLSPANGNAVPNTIHQHPRQRVLSPPEAAAIRERIMSEMMSLEEERMARMRASSRSSKTSWSGSDKSAHPETTEEESVVMRAVNKEDPSAAVFAESWPEKKARIRAASPYGHLANWDVFSLIVKTGADLRQEQLAVQIIKEFGRIWSETKCPHWVRYFRILVTSESTGLMETITDAISVHSIKKEAYAKLAAGASAANGANNTGYLPSFTLYDHFLQTYGAPDSVKYRKGQDAFLKSLASYSIISYLLQIKDRHNGNILLDKLGHLMRESPLEPCRIALTNDKHRYRLWLYVVKLAWRYRLRNGTVQAHAGLYRYTGWHGESEIFGVSDAAQKTIPRRPTACRAHHYHSRAHAER